MLVCAVCYMMMQLVYELCMHFCVGWFSLVHQHFSASCWYWMVLCSVHVIVWPELLNILFLYLLFFSIPSITNIRRCVLLNGVACVHVDVWTWVTCFSSCLLTSLPTSVGEFYWMVLCCVCDQYILTCFSLNCLLALLSTSGGEFYWIALCCVLRNNLFFFLFSLHLTYGTRCTLKHWREGVWRSHMVV